MADLFLARSFGTHSGGFHADEVTACALLLYFDLIDRDKIIRTRDQDKLEHLEFVCDVGGVYDPSIKRFDHHQQDYKGLLSSAGMILQYLLDRGVISKDLYFYLNHKLVKGVDEIDNGLLEPKEGHCSFSSLIANFMPISYQASELDIQSAFEDALNLTFAHIRRLIQRYDYTHECKAIVKEEMAKKRDFLFFEKPLAWMDAFFSLGGEKHPAKFVVMPTFDQWKLRAIPPTSKKRMDLRHPLPKAWAGCLESELEKVSGIKGAVFCHKGRFISVWNTKEAVLKALAVVLEEEVNL